MAVERCERLMLLVRLPADCASHVCTFLSLHEVVAFGCTSRTAHSIAARRASHHPYAACETGDAFDIIEYHRWRQDRPTPLVLSVAQLMVASRSALGRATLVDVYLRLRCQLHVQPDDATQHVQSLASACARLIAVRSLRLDLRHCYCGFNREQHGASATCCLVWQQTRCLTDGWAHQLVSLELAAPELEFGHLPEHLIDWSRFTQLEHVHLTQQQHCGDLSALAALRFPARRGVLAINSCENSWSVRYSYDTDEEDELEPGALGVGELSQETVAALPRTSARHVVWQAHAVGGSASEPALGESADGLLCAHRSRLALLPSQLRSVVGQVQRGDALRQEDLYDGEVQQDEEEEEEENLAREGAAADHLSWDALARCIDRLPTSAPSLQKLILHAPRGANRRHTAERFHLPRLRRLRDLRSLMYCSAPYEYRLLHTGAYPPLTCLLAADGGSDVLYPALAELTVNYGCDGVEISEALMYALAAAMPRLRSLGCCTILPGQPLVGVFQQLHELTVDLPRITSQASHADRTSVVAAIVRDLPQLQSLHLRTAYWMFSGTEVLLLSTLVPLVRSSAALTLVTMGPRVPLSGPQWRGTAVPQTRAMVCQLHRLWRYLQPSHHIRWPREASAADGVFWSDTSDDYMRTLAEPFYTPLVRDIVRAEREQQQAANIAARSAQSSMASRLFDRLSLPVWARQLWSMLAPRARTIALTCHDVMRLRTHRQQEQQWQRDEASLERMVEEELARGQEPQQQPYRIPPRIFRFQFVTSA